MKRRSLFALFLCVCLFAVCFSGCSLFVTKGKMQSEIEAAWNSNTDYPANSFLVSLEELSQFVVTDVQETEEDCYTVSLEVTSPDVLDDLITYQSSIEQRPSDDAMNDKINELISNAQLKTTQQTLTVYKTDGGFTVVFNEAFIDAMCGYSYSYCMEELGKVLEGNEQ